MVQTETLFDEVKTIKRCICGCERNMIGLHPNRLVHPDCEETYDALRRTNRRIEKKEDRQKEIWSHANAWMNEHPGTYYSIYLTCLRYRQELQWLSMAGVIELARSLYKIKVPNAHRPCIREQLLEEHPDMKGWLR